MSRPFEIPPGERSLQETDPSRRQIPPGDRSQTPVPRPTAVEAPYWKYTGSVLHKPAKKLALAASQASASHEQRCQTLSERYRPCCSFGRPLDFEQPTHSERDSQDLTTIPHTPKCIEMQKASLAKLVGFSMTQHPRECLPILSDIGCQESFPRFQRLPLLLV